jgi:sugar-phosphatase
MNGESTFAMELSYAVICFDLFGTLVADDGRAIDGARELLASMPPDRIAVVTSAPRRVALGLMVRAQLFAPRVIVTADDVDRGKPWPDPYALAAARLAVDPSQALAVEDSCSGVDAAQAAGMDAVFVLRGRPASACARADFFLAQLERLTLAVRDDGRIAVAFERNRERFR